MLGIEEPWGEDRSMIRRFLPEYLRVATPTGLMRNLVNGGEGNGPIMKPCWTSLVIRVSIVSGSVRADWRLLQTWLVSGSVTRPGEKPWLRPSRKNRTKLGSGCAVSSDARAGMLIGVARCLDSQVFEGLVGL